jgi:hypothetical protein
MNPIVQKFLEGGLPEPMARALTAGSLPVSPLDLLQALAFAVFKETPFADQARTTLAGLPEGLLVSAIAGPVAPPDPLGLILMHRKETPLLETALLHESLTAEWMERVVPHLPGAVLEIPLNNQVFWIRRPAILDLLECHPESEYPVKRRINEFRRDVLRLLPPEVVAERLEIIDEVEAGRLDKAWAELPLPAPEEKDEDPEVALLQNKFVTVDGKEVALSLTQRVMKLRTGQKIMLAVKGGKEERTILIRSANRLVQMNVIRNPRITESEAAYIANMRTVHEEVLRFVSNNREWMKKYLIVKALILNPRTPLPIALNLLKRLIDMDVKLLIRDKNVSEILRREAKRMAEQRTSGKG